MASYLEIENSSLRNELEDMLREARLNEEKLRRFDQLERQLIGSNSLVELLELILTEYKQVFGVEFVTLTLIDPDFEVTRVLEREADGAVSLDGLTLIQPSLRVDSLFMGDGKPRLESFDEHLHQTIFENAEGAIASVALLPLSRKGELIGSLNFGSLDPARYVPGCGTNFLERLAAVVALCLEAALMRERLKSAGLSDGLTGVNNRRYFEHRYPVEISLSQRHNHPLACMLLDIDKFKRINDNYGHQTGDEVLRVVASIIQSQLRTGDTVARYGGEEFVVLLPRATQQHAQEIAERIRCSIAGKELRAVSGESLFTTISIGISIFIPETSSGDHTQIGESLLAASDKALYQAKHGGRNRVVCDGAIGLVDHRQAPWHQRLSLWLAARVGGLFRESLKKMKGRPEFS